MESAFTMAAGVAVGAASCLVDGSATLTSLLSVARDGFLALGAPSPSSPSPFSLLLPTTLPLLLSSSAEQEVWNVVLSENKGSQLVKYSSYSEKKDE